MEQECAPAKVDEEDTGQGAIDAVRRHQWDIVVLDIYL